MTIDQLQQALIEEGYTLTRTACAQVADAFAAQSGPVPDLRFLPTSLQIAVLAAFYRDYLVQAARPACGWLH